MSKLANLQQSTAAIEVVVAEDEPVEQLLLAVAAQGTAPTARIEFVDDGHELLDLLKERAEDHALPDLVVLDLRRPGMDGHEVLVELARDEELWQLPTLIWTSSDPDEDEQAWREGAVWSERRPESFAGYIELVGSLEERCDQLRCAAADAVDWDAVLERVLPANPKG